MSMVTIKMEEDLIGQAKRMAKTNEQSLSGYIRFLIKRDIESKNNPEERKKPSSVYIAKSLEQRLIENKALKEQNARIRSDQKKKDMEEKKASEEIEKQNRIRLIEEKEERAFMMQEKPHQKTSHKNRSVVEDNTLSKI